MGTDILKLNLTNEALTALSEKYQVIPDASTKDGYDAIKAGLSELRTLRNRVEKARKKEKDPHLKAGRLIDAEAKRVTKALSDIEDPMAKAKEEVDTAEQRMKEERLRALRERISEMTALVIKSIGKDSSVIAGHIEELSEIDPHSFYELSSEAAEIKGAILGQLSEILTDRLSLEASQKAAREKEKELEAVKEERRIDQMIINLNELPESFKDKSAKDIRYFIGSMIERPCGVPDHRAQEVEETTKRVMDELSSIASMKEDDEVLEYQREQRIDNIISNVNAMPGALENKSAQEIRNFISDMDLDPAGIPEHRRDEVREANVRVKRILIGMADRKEIDDALEFQRIQESLEEKRQCQPKLDIDYEKMVKTIIEIADKPEPNQNLKFPIYPPLPTEEIKFDFIKEPDIGEQMERALHATEMAEKVDELITNDYVTVHRVRLHHLERIEALYLAMVDRGLMGLDIYHEALKEIEDEDNRKRPQE